MKRLREDGNSNPPFKRPFISNGIPPGGAGIGGGGEGGAGGGGTGGQRLTTNDALSYLKQVKEMFQDQKEKYDRFLEVMKDFKAQRIDTNGVIARVKELFKGHNDLIFGFNTFLPKGYEITLIDEEDVPPKRAVEFEEAITFVNKIKNRFKENDHVYKSFLDILNMYRKEQKGINEVYLEVSGLFVDHPDLLNEFTRFLPDAQAAASAHNASLNRHPYQRYDERSSAVPTSRLIHSDKQRIRRDKFPASHGERDLSVERPEMDDDKTTIKLQKEQRRLEKESMDKRIRDQDYKESEHNNARDASMHRLPDKKNYVRKDDGLATNSRSISDDDKDALRRMYSKEFAFCDKVKERLRNLDDYQAFLKCLHIYSSEIITRMELQSLIEDLLGKYPDLMIGFKSFLEECENIDGFLAKVMDKRSLYNEACGSKSLRTEDKDRELRREMDSGKERDKSKDKYWGKSIQELDLNNCQRCTPSYRLLPDDYPIPVVTFRTETGRKVLNDQWVSVTQGSEDYSFKHMRRNQYEESLFRCEDDRFELDLLLESVSSTAKRAEELLSRLNDNSLSPESPCKIEDHFTTLHLRCIERLYGDHGLDVMDILRRNLSAALPVILTRLKQKQEEWTKCRSDFNKVWAEIYARNHYKSLDHRSFYFKQQDSKNLHLKSLVAEIKELKEEKQKEDDVLLTFAAGSRHSICPHMEFEFSDEDIHEDLYKLIKYSCEEICTKDQVKKVLKLWTYFFEPMLGIHSRPHGSEGNEEATSRRSRVSKVLCMDVGENGSSSIADGTTMDCKQPKPRCNGDDTPARANRDTLTMEKGFGPEKEDKSFAFVDKVSRLNGSETSADKHMDSNTGKDNCGIGFDPTLPGPSNAAGDAHEKSPIKDVAMPDISVANEDFPGSSTARRFEEDFVEPSKFEKEEGELSPNGDLDDEVNFAAHGDDASHANLPHGSREEIHSQDGVAVNDAEADDEESENASAAGDDVSGSESAADEGSREEQEEEDGEHDEVDGKAESEGEAEGVDDANCVTSLLPSERFLLTVKPLTKHVSSHLCDSEVKDNRVFYGNDAFFYLFRLHQVLYDRILSAKLNSASAEAKWRTAKDTCPQDLYSRFLSSLYKLLDGSADNAKFEDDCRAIIGNQSYVLFTLDKLIYKLVKQLQNVACDEMDNKLLKLYEYEKSRKSERYVDSVYYENAHVLVQEDNIYRFQCSSSPSRLSIQLMDDGSEKPEVIAVSVDPKFSAYLHNDFFSAFPNKREPNVFLQRNKINYSSLEETMEGVRTSNGLEYKINCNTSKISYVLDTKDFFFRERRRRRRVSGGSSGGRHHARLERYKNSFK